MPNTSRLQSSSNSLEPGSARTLSRTTSTDVPRDCFRRADLGEMGGGFHLPRAFTERSSRLSCHSDMPAYDEDDKRLLGHSPLGPFGPAPTTTAATAGGVGSGSNCSVAQLQDEFAGYEGASRSVSRCHSNDSDMYGSPRVTGGGFWDMEGLASGLDPTGVLSAAKLCRLNSENISEKTLPISIRGFSDQCSMKHDPRLPEAAAAGDWEAVRQMLRELGPGCINSRDSGGSGILHWAIRAGKTPFVKELLDDRKYANMLNINMMDANGMTPLMLSVQYERTKILYHLLEQGADYEQTNANGETVLALLEIWMRESGSDLRLEREVIVNAMSKVETQLSESEELGVRGLLHTLQNTQSVVAWRRVCEVLHNRMLREKGKTEQPNTRQVFQMGFDKLIFLADLNNHSVHVRRVVPVMRILVALAEADFFTLTTEAVRVLEQMLSSCRSALSCEVRTYGCQIVHALTRTSAYNKDEIAEILRTSRCAEPLYLICFFDEIEELQQSAKGSLEKMGLDTTKPPDVLNWGTDEVMLWLSMSLRFDYEAAAALKKEDIDGPSLLYLNDVLVSRIEQLTTKQCIELLNAVEQLKAEHKSWTGYDVFFSYRRNHSALVRLYALQMRGVFNCFIDMEGLTAGAFNEQIFRRIHECRFFVVFFTEGTVERLNLPGDWVLREIEKALDLRKIIVPVYYHMSPPAKEELPEAIRQVLKFQAIMHSRDETETSCVRKLIQWLQEHDQNERRLQQHRSSRRFLTSSVVESAFGHSDMDNASTLSDGVSSPRPAPVRGRRTST